MAGHEKCDGDFELRIGPTTSTDGAESVEATEPEQPEQSTSALWHRRNPRPAGSWHRRVRP